MIPSGFDFLRKMLKAASPSGFESEAAQIWKDEAEEYFEEVRGDVHGNSIAKLPGGGDKTIMLAGHIDEIGLMVSYIDPDGFIYFRPIGGWNAQILLGQRVKIYGKRIVKGVIGCQPPHTLNDGEKSVKIEDLWIDAGIGANVSEYVSVGDSAVLNVEPEIIFPATLVSRGIDDKIGAFVALEVLKRIKEKLAAAPEGEKRVLNFNVCAVATVQEEIGLRGAKTSAYGINPDIGIAIDVTFASDYPTCDKRKTGDIKLGGGPVISVGPNINPRISALLLKIAKENKIPHQIEAAPGGTYTDANAIQLTKSGVAAGLVSIPNRYMHSPCEMINLDDVDNAINLLALFCLNCEFE